MYREINRRRTSLNRDGIIGIALCAVSLVTLAAYIAGAAYCDFDPNAIRGECLQSIYNALIVD